jgi:hypothetical protein
MNVSITTKNTSLLRGTLVALHEPRTRAGHRAAHRSAHRSAYRSRSRILALDVTPVDSPRRHTATVTIDARTTTLIGSPRPGDTVVVAARRMRRPWKGDVLRAISCRVCERPFPSAASV